MFLNKFFHTARKIQSQIREVGKIHLRSSKWGSVRDNFLEGNLFCAACGSHKHLQVHHVQPFHLNPALELDVTNLLVLCMDELDCHLLLGHGDSFRCYNPNVREDVAKFRVSTKEEREIIVKLAKDNRLKD
jgi:hypothetical protein